MMVAKQRERRDAKVVAHRKYRRKWRQAIRKGDEGPRSVDTGFFA
jgi:hypothetical protein